MARPVKPPAARLYGRVRGKTLRPRQKRLLEVALPRLAVGDVLDWPRPGRPLWVEIGFGGGEHLVAQTAAHPDIDLIGCEVFDTGLAGLLSRLIPAPGDPATAPLPDQLRVWADDARLLLRDLPTASIARLFLLFPDPWPKARHAKRRFVHPEALGAIGRVLRPGAIWRIASDDPIYQAWTTAVLADQPLFEVPPPSNERPAGWPPTRYEAKARAAGRTPLYWSVRRR